MLNQILKYYPGRNNKKFQENVENKSTFMRYDEITVQILELQNKYTDLVDIYIHSSNPYVRPKLFAHLDLLFK